MTRGPASTTTSRTRRGAVIVGAIVASVALASTACAPQSPGAGGKPSKPSVAAPAAKPSAPGAVKPGGGSADLTAPTSSSVPTSSAPSTPSQPSTPSAPTSSNGQGIQVDPATLPTGDPGASTQVIGPARYSKFTSDGSAQFRTNCFFSHMRYDDPIVAPGQPGASHLHAFFGNTAIDANTTPGSVATTGNSTCEGGTANRTAYWAPAVIDTATNTAVVSTNDPHALQIYYKTGYDGVRPETIQNFPTGLRMIAGNARSTTGQERVTYSCAEGNGPNISNSASFPNCAPGQLLVMSIGFPQCWDGINLDSPDHKSHMAYGAGWPDKGCPTSHPVPLAQVTQNYRYRVPTTGMATWRLASDMYTGPAGYSGHADWMNGWDPTVFQRIIDNCYKGGYDCQMNLLGDGQALTRN